MTNPSVDDKIVDRSPLRAMVHALERRVAFLMLAPAIILICGLALGPAGSSIWLSLQDRSLTEVGDHGFVGLQNYANWLSDPVFWNAVQVSVIFTFASVFLQLLIGLGLALLLNRAFPFRNLFRAMILIPWLLPVVSTANSWVWILNDVYGVVGGALYELGLVSAKIPFLSSTDFSLISVILVKTWREFPFAALLLLATLQTIPREHYEAARLDGATAFQQFRFITLPALWLSILVIMLLQSIWTFNDPATVFLLTAGGPGRSTEVMPILIYNASFVAGDLSRGAAGAVLMFFFVALLTTLYFRNYTRTEAKRRA